MEENERFIRLNIATKEERHKNNNKMFKIIQLFFDNQITRNELYDMDIIDLYGVFYDITIAIETTIHKRLVEFVEPPEQPYKSRYNDYDKEHGIEWDEYGNIKVNYEKKEEIKKTRWQIYRECIRFIFRQSIELCNNSQYNCQHSNLAMLIDDVKFAVDNFESSIKYKEIEARANSLM